MISNSVCRTVNDKPNMRLVKYFNIYMHIYKDNNNNIRDTPDEGFTSIFTDSAWKRQRLCTQNSSYQIKPHLLHRTFSSIRSSLRIFSLYKNLFSY